MLKVKKCWHHLLLADAISFFVTRLCQTPKKMMKIDENYLILTENFPIYSERLEEIQ